ncbi:unnamed protein product [Effrenium voratum]|nr:unnamed protein product [Effrenium voratum]
MFRNASTPSFSGSDPSSPLRSSPSRRPPLRPYERRAPCLDGACAPFTELSLARQSSMRLPPLRRESEEFRGRWSAPASRESEALGTADFPPAPNSAPADSKKIRPGPWARIGHCSADVAVGDLKGVFKALEKQTGRIFAVKQSPLEAEADEKLRERLQEELRICKDLRHPNIVACLGFECTKDSFYIQLEYVPGGSMSKLLKEFGPLEGRLLKQCSEGVLEGLSYLHTQNPPVVHRDIKGANILVDLNFNVKLSDFGCSKKEDLTKSFTTIGSIPWMAPEVILQREGHGRKADLWSLGCAVLEMATAEKPWGNDAFDNVMFALKHISMTDAIPPIPDSLGEAGEAFVRACVQRDPSQRPSAEQLLQHRWFEAGP